MNITKLSDLFDATNERPFISTDLGSTTKLVYESSEIDTKSRYGAALILIGRLPEPAKDGHTHERVRINNKLGKLIVIEARAAGRTDMIPGDTLTFHVADKEPFGDEGKEAPIWDIGYEATGDPLQADLFPDDAPFDQ